MLLNQMFIDGRWVDSESGQRFSVISPVTGDSIGDVPEGTRADAQAAIAAANRAWRGWAAHSAFERAEILLKAAELAEERRDELAHLLTLEQGKPLQAESFDEVDGLIEYFKMSAAEAVRLEGHILPSQDRNKSAFVQRVPRGVVGVISPWNWPYTMPGELIAPALAVGNAVVWACAPSTPFTAIALAKLLEDAGVPAGVVNLVTGPGPIVGDEIAVNPGTHAIGFVGSVSTGKMVARQAAGKELLLELGGNGPLVVMDDADLDRAVAGTLYGAFLCSGQSCSASELILVHESVKAAYLDKLVAATLAEVRLGDPFESETTMGPLNNEKTAEKMDEHVADAVAKGATVVAGGGRASEYPTSLYYQPTILDGVTGEMMVATEETFGPIVPIRTFASDEELIEITDASEYGLTMAVYTDNIKRGWKLANRLRSGTVVINDSTNWYEDHIPFGGSAGTDSGFGRVGGRFAIERFTDYKTIFVDWQ